jgi:MSHA biogenesis protein MshQ
VPAGTSPYIGRFRPARYAVTFSDITPACTTNPPGFTYARQPFTGSMTIEAQNSTGALTSNYRDGFATLTPATELTFINDQTGAGYNGQTIGFIQDFSSAPTGSAMLDLEFSWNMPRQAPADSTVQLTASTDEVTAIAGAPVAIGLSNVRFGRMFLENVYGSELLPLTVPLRAEYATDATQFTLNVDDGCTSYDATDVTLLNPNPPAFSVVSPGGAGTLVNGVYNPAAPLRFTTPPGTPGSIDARLDVPSHLEYDWDNDGSHDDDPTSRVTFGIYGGPEDNQIYIREVY